MEALQLLHLCLVDGYVHPAFLLLNHLYRQFDLLICTHAPEPFCRLPSSSLRSFSLSTPTIRPKVGTYTCVPLSTSWLIRLFLTPQAVGVFGVDVCIVPHHLPADQIRLLVQHLRVSTGHRRPYCRNDPPPDQGVAKHQLREGHIHPSVQPDRLADWMGVLHDVPITGLDAVRV